MEKNQNGYLRQKGNRYFINKGAITYFNAGFKSKEQFNQWIEEEFAKRGLDWRVKFIWKYKDEDKIYKLVNGNGSLVV